MSASRILGITSEAFVRTSGGTEVELTGHTLKPGNYTVTSEGQVTIDGQVWDYPGLYAIKDSGERFVAVEIAADYVFYAIDDLSATFGGDGTFVGFEPKAGVSPVISGVALSPGATIRVEGFDISQGEAIESVDEAITIVSRERSKLGAYQNRLDHIVSNLGTSAINLQNAESRVRDLDIAREMMSLTKSNVLDQVANAMLAQANVAPQSVLQLLG